MLALLMHKGLSAGAAMAFLLIGPATNVNTWSVLGEHHGRRTATLFAVGLFVVAIAMGYGVDLWLPADFTVPIHEMHREGHRPIAWVSLAVLAFLLVLSLLRQGVAGFVRQLMALFGHRHEHVQHEHGHHHQH